MLGLAPIVETTLKLECPLCKHYINSYLDSDKFDILINGAVKYHYCPHCGGSAPKTNTAKGWIRWCSKVDSYFKKKGGE